MNDDQHSKQTAFTGALKLVGHVQDVNISIASMIFRSARRVEAAVFVVVVVGVGVEMGSNFFLLCSLCSVHALHGSGPLPSTSWS
jgi:hypothetical protein